MGKESNIGNIKKIQNKALLTAVVLSVMLVAGVPMIVFGATGKIWLLMAVGIAFTVLGFYGCPIAWVRYGETSRRKAVFFAIDSEGIDSVDMLCTHIGKNKNVIVSDIRWLIEKRCLAGYFFDGVSLTDGKKKTAPQRVTVGKCPACSATMVYEDGKVVCPYCGYVATAGDRSDT